MEIAFSSPSLSKADSRTAPRPLVRRAGHPDLPFFRSLLAHAYGWHVNVLETELPVGRYVDGWGRAGDTGFVWTDRGHRVGAGWYRLFNPAAPGWAYVDDETPELTVAVVPSRQGQGVGEVLLGRLVEQAQADGRPALSVSVRRGHADLAVYDRAGFAPLREDGGAVTLVRPL
jgi:GNAT superfamily N-acetyltransferase